MGALASNRRSDPLEGRTLYITAQTGVYSIDVEGARSR